MSRIIGIDLGTTNSVASVWNGGRPETIPIEGRGVMPSVISFCPDGRILVGKAAKARAAVEPESSICSSKRFIGDGMTKWTIHGNTYTPIDAAARILGRLKAASEEYLKEPVTQAVVCVPAYFNNDQKRSTLKSAEVAGLEVLRLMPEPTAAAASYGLDKGRDQILLVYDLGGGTFDVSVGEVKGNSFRVRAVDGDSHLGGDDFDMRIVDYLIALLEKKKKSNLAKLRSLFSGKNSALNGISKEDLSARRILKEAAEAAKIELSESDEASITLPMILGASLDVTITVETLNNLIAPLVDRTIAKVQDVLKAAGLTREDIDRVILVGGATRTRLVRSRVAEALKDPWTADNVDEVVSHGAAIEGHSLSSPEEDLAPLEVYNVTPFSLGVCATEDEDSSCFVNSVIISKNRPVPCVESRPYDLLTMPDRDNHLEVHVLQGESREPSECLMAGKYVFSGIAHVPGGRAGIDIQYGYDENGVITVNARERLTGKELPFTVEQTPGDDSWLEKLRKPQVFDLSTLRLTTTVPCYDDIAAVLRTMGLSYRIYQSGEKLDCDIFFLN